MAEKKPKSKKNAESISNYGWRFFFGEYITSRLFLNHKVSVVLIVVVLLCYINSGYVMKTKREQIKSLKRELDRALGKHPPAEPLQFPHARIGHDPPCRLAGPWPHGAETAALYPTLATKINPSFHSPANENREQTQLCPVAICHCVGGDFNPRRAYCLQRIVDNCDTRRRLEPQSRFRAVAGICRAANTRRNIRRRRHRAGHKPHAIYHISRLPGVGATRHGLCGRHRLFGRLSRLLLSHPRRQGMERLSGQASHRGAKETQDQPCAAAQGHFRRL